MNFKVKFWKTLVSVLSIIIWYLYNRISMTSICNSVGACLPCKVNGFPSLIPNCCGCGAGIYQIISQLIIILIPGIIIYIIWSLIEKNKKRVRK